jgi:uncharacterized damage-inducible protein DinB
MTRTKFAVCLALSGALAGQNPNVLGSDAKQAYTQVKNNLLASAEKMPEEFYGFKPAPRIRTFGQILGHLAEEQYMYCSAVNGEDKAIDAEKSKTSKADLVTALKDSFAYCDSAYDGLTDATAIQTVKRGRAEVTRLRLLWNNTVHDNSHYGNLVTYMRIKGLVPPSTEGQ